jgi:hypothetical protein
MSIFRPFAFAIVLGLGTVSPIGSVLHAADSSTTTTVSATQVREQWAKAKKSYQDSIAPYAGQAQHAALIKDYNSALDDTGKSLETFIKLKLSSPPSPASEMTPAVDQLAKNLGRLKTLQGKASGDVLTVLGGALKQQQQITQNALKNMR